MATSVVVGRRASRVIRGDRNCGALAAGAPELATRHALNVQILEMAASRAGQLCRELLIYAGSIDRGHVPILIGIPPQISISRAVLYLKGKSSQRLLSEYRYLRKHYWVASIGNVTDEVWKADVKNQKPPQPDDDFAVVCWESAGWPIDPAVSRNRKPPASAGGVFTRYMRPPPGMMHEQAVAELP